MTSKRQNGVCVIVLNYYGAELTRRCARSLLEQRLDTLYLVDNSTDPAQVDAMHRLKQELDQGAGFRTQLLLNGRNLGFGRAINRVLTEDRCRSPHQAYLLLNNDALLSKGSIERLWRTMQQPSSCLVAPRVCSADGAEQRLYYVPALGHTTRHPNRFAFPFATGACLLVNEKCIGEHGLFDEDFFMYGEDILLSRQISRQAGSVRWVEDVEVIHEGSASSRNRSLFYEYHVARGHLLLADKLANSDWQRRRFLLGRAVYLTARAGVRALRWRSFVPIRGLWMAWLEKAPPPPPKGE